MFDTLLDALPFAIIAYLIYINRKSMLRIIKSLKLNQLISLILSYVIMILMATYLLYAVARPFVNNLDIQNNILKAALIFTLIIIVLVPTQYAIYKITQYFTKRGHK